MFFIGMSYIKTEDDNKGLSKLLKFCICFEKLPAKIKFTYVIEYAIAKNNISRILFFSKKLDKIEKYLKQAKFQLINCEKINHEVYLSVNHNLINYYNFSKQTKKAIKIIENLLSPETMIIHKRITASMHQSASVTYYDLGNFDKAHQHLDSACKRQYIF